MQDLVTTGIVFGIVSLCSATVALVVTGRIAGLRGGRAGAARSGPIFADTPRRYEFHEGYLLSPIDPNDAFLPEDTDRSSAFDVLSRALATLNAELPVRLAALARRGEAFVLPGSFGPDALSVAGRQEAGRLIVTVGPTEAGSGRQVVDAPVLDALQTEIEDLRRAIDLGRAAMWQEDSRGVIVWANAPYLSLVERLAGDEAAAVTWPLRPLFADQLDPPPDPGSVRRCRLVQSAAPPDARGGGHPAGGALWFEVSSHRQDDGGLLCCAVPIDTLVAAETSLRNFVQTLSLTFAHLPIGLAIFDRRRELMLFNPALVTLSTLAPEFLSRRPGLVAFLDALRDRQRMPEPKNYRSWRDEIARLEQRAEQGTYQELWTLPTGQSFRVIGRPHPDGAVAFMFEDITSEVSLTRQFRGDLDLYQAVLDDTPGAVAVFSAEGRLVMANTGHARLWGGEVRDMIGVLTVAEATRAWQAQCLPTGCWGDIRHFATASAERAVWEDEVLLHDGRRLRARVAPLAGGAMSVRFMGPEAEALEPVGIIGLSDRTPDLTPDRTSDRTSDRARALRDSAVHGMADPAGAYHPRAAVATADDSATG